jgi:hypothetical protein
LPMKIPGRERTGRWHVKKDCALLLIPSWGVEHVAKRFGGVQDA